MKKVILGLLVVGGLGLMYNHIRERKIEESNRLIEERIAEMNKNQENVTISEYQESEPNIEVTYESNNPQEENVDITDRESALAGLALTGIAKSLEYVNSDEYKEYQREQESKKILMNCRKCHGTGMDRQGYDCGRCDGRGQVFERP
jgi:hypothetical protein